MFQASHSCQEFSSVEHSLLKCQEPTISQHRCTDSEGECVSRSGCLVGSGVNVSVIFSICCDTFCSSRHSHRLFLPTDDDLWTDVCIATAPLRLHTVAVMGCFCFLFHSMFPSYCPHHLESLGHSSSPLCSGMASGNNQSSSDPRTPAPLSFPSPSHSVHSSQFGGDYVF